MSTQENTVIPNDDDVKTPSRGGQSWRASAGKICKGKEGEDGYEVREKMTGRIVKIGELDWINENKNNDPERKLLVQMNTANGEETFAVKFFQKKRFGSYAQFFGLAQALLLSAENDLVTITASLGKKPVSTPDGEQVYPTYVNLYKVLLDDDGKVTGTREIRGPKAERDENSTPEGRLLEVLEQLKSLPYWGEFKIEKGEGGGYDTHLSEFRKMLVAKGWPSLEAEPDAWGEVFKALLKEKFGGIDSISEDTWGDLRQGLGKRDAAPKLLTEFIAAKKAAGGVTEKDIFEDI